MYGTRDISTLNRTVSVFGHGPLVRGPVFGHGPHVPVTVAEYRIRSCPFPWEELVTVAGHFENRSVR